MEAGDIKLSLLINEDTLTFTLQNPVAKNVGKMLEEPGGIGISNVSKRLQHLYPKMHHLESNLADDVFTVMLSIQGLNLVSNEKQIDLLHH